MKLCELGFIPSKVDTSLFVFNKSDITIYVLVYVDDIIIISSHSSATERLIKQLSSDVVVKDLGPLRYFLRIEATPKDDWLVLTQHKYVSNLLHKMKMQYIKPIDTPMSNLEKLSRDCGTTLSEDDTHIYRSTMGSLQYLTLTRPVIAFSVNKVCQFLQAPTNIHWGH